MWAQQASTFLGVRGRQLAVETGLMITREPTGCNLRRGRGDDGDELLRLLKALLRPRFFDEFRLEITLDRKMLS
jgi:hypothetical protein